MFCYFHKHTSPETAQRCYAQYMGRRADRAIQRSGVLTQPPTKCVQVVHTPPKVEKKGPIEIVIFYSA